MRDTHTMENTIKNNIKTKYVFKAILFCVVFIGLLVFFSIAKGFIPNKFERVAYGIIGTLSAFLATALFLKFDKQKFSDIGLIIERKTIVKFFAGVVIGIVIMGSVALSVIYFTHLKIHINPHSNFFHFLLMTLPLIPLAFMEELGFRAYPLEILKDKVGIRLSIIITSILFGLYHIVGGWTSAITFYGPAIWGLIYGLAAIYSKGIALPSGIHYAANLTTSAFGEKNTTASIWTIEQPENSPAKYGGVDWATILPSLALLVFAIICIEFYIRRKTTANMTWPLATVNK